MTNQDSSLHNLEEIARSLGVYEAHLLKCVLLWADSTLILVFHTGNSPVDLVSIQQHLKVNEVAPATIDQLIAAQSNGILKPTVLIQQGVGQYTLLPIQSDAEGNTVTPFSLQELLLLLGGDML
jgi:hypothetical protein